MANRSKAAGCRNCGQKGHDHLACKSEAICFYCKAKGHRQYDCPLLAQRKGNTAGTQPKPRVSVAAAETAEPPTEDIAAVADRVDDLRIETSRPYVEVTSIAGRDCRLAALIDTGSPVLFVKRSHVEKLVLPAGVHIMPVTRRFRNLSNESLRVMGVVNTVVAVDLLGNRKFEVSLHVIDDTLYDTDIILGRDFLENGKLTFIYKYRPRSDTDSLAAVDLLQFLPVNAVEEPANNNIEEILEQVEIDFDQSVKTELRNVVVDVCNSNVSQVDDGYTVKVYLKDESIYAYAPRRFAYAERLQIREITDDLLRRGIIQPSISPYCARVIPVRKKNGSLRLCVDLRPLNSRVFKQKYPFPLVEDCLSRLSSKRVFTLLDLKDSFHQIKVHPDYTKYFAFATPDGQFEYKCLPFGYSESPAEFQKRVMNVLNPLVRQGKVTVYIDDVLIPTETVEENLSLLREVLLLLKKYGFELNYSKCQFLRQTIEFLGYIVSADGITLSARHTSAVNNFPQPRNVTEVQQFLGLASYFRKFVKDFALKTRPLQTLLKKDVDFVFTEPCRNSFNLLKNELVSAPILCLYDPAAQTELHTDACSMGLGAILLQKQKNGAWSPVAYFSQTTNQAESRYHSFELEMLAVVRAIERFHIYLYGVDFTIVTDCNALVYAVNKANLNPRIARWTLALQGYRFRMLHRAGKNMQHVDALSRNINFVNALPLDRELKFHQLIDSNVKEIARELEVGDNEKFELIDGLVYRKSKEGLKFVIPDMMIDSVLRADHDDMAHAGFEKTYRGVATNYWFPSMRNRINQYIENCFTCLMASDATNRFEAETSLVPAPQTPFEIIHVDHFGPLEESNDHYKHVLVVVDAFTQFTWLSPCKSMTTKETIRNLKSLFSTFGNPVELVSDRGTAFTSKEFEEFSKSVKFKHRKVAVAAPWANGLVERVNRFIKSLLTKMLDDAGQWKENLGQIQYLINNTHHASLKATPAKLLLGYEQRNHADF